MGPEQEQQLGVLHKAALFDFTQSSSALFCFFSDPTTQLGSAIQRPNTDSGGCLSFFSTPRPRLGFVFIYSTVSTTYSNTDSGEFVCWFACSFVRLFVCLGLFVSLFLRFTVQRPRLGFLFYLLYRVVRRNSSASASRGRHGGRGVQQHPGSHQELPRLRRQEGTRSRFKNTRASCASACLSTARPYSKCFKARPSHHLLWTAPTPRRLMLSLATNGYRRTKISGVFYFSPHLAPPTPSRSPSGSGLKTERGMDSLRRRLWLRSTTATLRRPEGRAPKNSSTRRWSPAKIRTTSFSFWTNAVISSRKWDRQYTTRGTRTSFSRPFRRSTRRCELPVTRGGTLGWTTFGTWYTLCTSTTFRAPSTLNRSQAAALPCRW